MFQCKFCFFKTSKVTQLLQHCAISHGQNTRQHQCIDKTCRQVFNTFMAMKFHFFSKHFNKLCNSNVHNAKKIKCERCSANIDTTRKIVLSHLCNHINNSEVIACPISGCDKIFRNEYTFRAHIYRKHSTWNQCIIKENLVIENSSQTSLAATDTEMDSEMPNNIENEPYIINSLDPDSKDGADNLTQFMSNFFLKLECKLNMTKVAINEIASDILHILELHSNYRSHEITLYMKDFTTTEILEKLKLFMSSLQTPIENSIKPGGLLSTSFKRLNYIRKNNTETYTEPLAVEIQGKDGKSYEIMYFPILKNLLSLLTHKEIINEIQQEDTGLSGIISSYRDGNFYKEHPLFSSHSCLSLKLNLYLDEVQLTDPIAAFKNKYKTAGIYWTILNVRPGLRSQLHCIQIAIVFNYNILKHVEMSQILEPLLVDIRELEKKGIFVPKLEQTVKGAVLYVSGDNLSMNALAGICGKFSGDTSQACRACNIKKGDIAKGVEYADTRQNGKYEEDLRKVLSCVTKTSNGVKGASPLDTLKYFSVPRGFPFDIVHDLLEGCIPREIALILTEIVRQKIISKSEVIELIENFKYKDQDKVNKPVINKFFDEKRNVGGNASRNWTLLRMLPIIMYGLIPEDFLPWQILLLLKQITQIAFSPKLHKSSLSKLKSLLDMHRKLYVQIFPNEPCTFKLHFIEHYVEAIENYGPLTECWTMRFEAKHQYIKSIVKRSHNFINPWKHIAMKTALMLHFNLSSEHFFNIDNCSSVTEKNLEDLELNLRHHISNRNPKITTINTYTNIEYNGVVYKEKSAVFLKDDGVNNILFGLINSIMNINGKIHLWVEIVRAFYNINYDIYELDSSKRFTLIEIDKLTSHQCIVPYLINNLRLISMKHDISGL
jgi:hypothetical protein